MAKIENIDWNVGQKENLEIKRVKEWGEKSLTQLRKEEEQKGHSGFIDLREALKKRMEAGI